METRNDASFVLNDYRLSEPEHPGRILQEELKSRGIRQKEFCAQIGVQPSYLSALIHGNRNITAEMASRLEKALSIPATVWLNLQNLYDLEMLSADVRTPARPYPILSRRYAEPVVLRDDNLAPHKPDPSVVTLTVTLPAEDADLLNRLASRFNWDIG